MTPRPPAEPRPGEAARSDAQAALQPATDKKAALRSRAAALRAALPAEAHRALARALAAAIGAELARAGPLCLAAYLPIRSEPDPVGPLSALAGLTLCLPVVTGPDSPLVFRALRPGAALEEGPFGTRHPPPSAPELRPDAILLPCLAFDDTGTRLGYGGGFYDRTLAALAAQGHRPRAWGHAFAAQRMAGLPREGHDIPLDGVITEAGLAALPRA